MPIQTSNPIRILLIEANISDANLVAEYLKQAMSDYEVTTVESLNDGLEKLRLEKFDVILLDLSLPDSEGIRTLEEVKERAKDTVIITLTDSDDETLPSAALQAGAQDYLYKDKLSTEVLHRSILYAIERTRLTLKLENHANEIEHREALLRNIFDANTDAMLILTLAYQIKFFNPAAARLLEADEISLVGEIFPFEVSTTQLTELEIPEAKGEFRIVELSAADLVWEGEGALLVMLRDITQRRTAELELKREQERLSVTINSIADAVITTDNSGAIERMNREAARLTGISNADASGKPLAEVLRLRNPNSGKVIENPAAALCAPENSEDHSRTGLLLERENGQPPLVVTAEMCCILDEEGVHHGCVTVLRDITNQKKTEEELTKSEKHSSISLIVSGIAHDFNNMLAAILGNISVVRLNIDPDDKNANKLLAAETAALQAKSLTQQLLTFTRGGSPSLETTAIDQLVEESAHFILRGSNVKCEINQDEPLWAVEGDKGQISQVINNLIINADQAMPGGGTIQLRLRNCRLRHAEVTTLKAGEYVCVDVIDRGTGISPENMKRIFDPYFTTKNDGNGLGLASSYSIVKSHHGAITVESQLGQGTCFSVYLPKTEKVAKAETPTEQKPDKKQSEKIHQGRGRILVMDDMEAMMMVAGDILNALGYEVAFTTNGEEAIEAYKKAKESGDPFDAVVFDLTVPGGMGGEEASEILIEYDPDLIAIASSGYTTSNVMSDHKKSAFKAVVPKPYRIKEMSDALRSVLSDAPE